MMAQIAGERHLSLPQVWSELNGGFRMSYLVMFGQFNIPADSFVYYLFDLLLALGALGLCIATGRVLLRAWQTGGSREDMLHNALRDAPRAVPPLLLGALIALSMIGIARWTMITQASQGRLLFPAIAAVSTLLAIGLRQFEWPIRLPRFQLLGLVTPGMVALMGTLALVSPWRYIVPAYAPPLLDRMPDDMQPVTQSFLPWAELVAYRMSPAVALPGQTIRVTAVLRALQTPRDDYSLVTKLYGRDNVELARFDTFTGGGLLPSSQWRPGDLWRDDVQLTIPFSASTPTILKAQFELYNHGSGDIVASLDGRGQPGAPLFDGATLLPLVSPADTTTRPLATFGDAARLNAFKSTELRRGRPLTVTLAWVTMAPTPRDFSVFVHLLDQAGKVWAQHDGPPDGGNYPTSRWSAGIGFDDAHLLDVPAGLPPGEYRLAVGLYDPATGERLPVRDRAGMEHPNRAFVILHLLTE